ncbi:MAE_28990/MAE_18760 family HEPN-like nuclease [Gimesia chilikensis]|uniref:RiboL-PSP-HEPN domain-containing protein n=1 Tax=Gimesia chilikensis TaxID=2605989 RepID=A0A517PYG5_9PLAN|nr:MAE_28990/MAE_18760 family HEPN-like nuclease [Gimesia chilikensis]QDT24425.1 hypothetical protein HG66A1_62570 [Gimesia chilikensis]
MDVAEVRAELEEEMSRRLNEIRFFRNQLSELDSKEEKERYCQCLVVMLYAHFEGFWKAAFSIYLKAINQEQIMCKNAVEQLVAASMNDLFTSLSDPHRKCTFFRNPAPDDTKLHRFARHSEFVARLDDALSTIVSIPIDDVVDTESNLKPVVVRKNLFRLGFSHEEFKSEEGTINELLRRRNDIAHGSSRIGVPVDSYSNLESSVVGVMRRIVILIFESLRERRFEKQVDSTPSEVGTEFI